MKSSPPEPKSALKSYTRDVHVRVTEEEYESIVSHGRNLGIRSFSDAVRNLLFGRGITPVSRVPDGEFKYNIMTLVQNIRSSFKKVCTSVGDAVEVYSRSIDMLDESGRPLLSTEHTIRHISALECQLLDVQSSLNEVLEKLEAPSVHFAAKMSPGSKVGQLVDEYRKREDLKAKADSAEAAAATEANPNQSAMTIPNKYRYMFKVIAIGELVADVQEFTSKSGKEMMNFRIKVETRRFSRMQTYLIDVVCAKRPDVFPLLKKDFSVSVTGAYSDDIIEKDGEAFVSRTILADFVSVPFRFDPATPVQNRNMLKASVTGSLVFDAEPPFKSKTGKDLMSFRVKVQTFRFSEPKTHYINIIMPKSAALDHLKKDTGVTVFGDYDDNLKTNEAGRVLAKTIYGEELAIPT